MRATGLRRIASVPAKIIKAIGLLRLDWAGKSALPPRWSNHNVAVIFDVVWYAMLAALTLWAAWQIVGFVSTTLSWGDLGQTAFLTTLTMARVIVLIAMATVFWVPISVWIGLRPALAEKAQPLAQFLAAFPANVVRRSSPNTSNGGRHGRSPWHRLVYRQGHGGRGLPAHCSGGRSHVDLRDRLQSAFVAAAFRFC